MAMTEKERYYRELLRKQRKSGTSLKALAEEEGIPASRLRGWKCLIAKKDRQRAGTARGLPSQAAKTSAEVGTSRSETRAEPASSLLPVRVVGGAVGSSGVEPSFEVLLRSGHLVRVPETFESDSLGRLVQVLEATC